MSLHHFLANIFNDTWCDQQRGSVVPEAREQWLTGRCGQSLTNQALSRRLQAGVQESEDENPGYPKKAYPSGKMMVNHRFVGVSYFQTMPMRNRVGRTWNQRWLCSGNLVDNTCNTGGRTTVTIRFQTSMIVQGLFPKCTSDCCHTWQGTPRCKSTVWLEHLRWMWNTHVGAKTRSDDLKQSPVDMHMQNMHATDPNGLLLKTFDWLMLAVHCTAIKKLPRYQSALSIWKHQLEPTDCSCLCSKNSNSTCSPRGQRVPGHLDVGNRCPTAPRSFLRPCFQTMGAPMRPAQHKMHKPDNSVQFQNLRKIIANWCLGVNVLSGSNIIGFQLGKWQF